MKMIPEKMPALIKVSAVLLSFFCFAACTALYLNTPPSTMAVLPSPTTVEMPKPVTRVKLTVKVEPPVPAETTLEPDLTELLTASDAVCRDSEVPDEVDVLLAAAIETPQTEKDPQAEEKPQKEPEKPEPPFHRLILQAAIAHEVKPALIKAVILAESNYNPRAVSKSGARGLMQLMPQTAAALGVTDLFDPEDNINGGVKYLRQLLDRFDNDVRLALAAYNAGSRHVRNYNGVPPFRATRLYIKKVFKYQALFEEELAAHRQTV
jgi:hypothetical protein